MDIAPNCKPDAIEVLTGLMPTVIEQLTNMTSLPFIAGGLIRTKEDILKGLREGAPAIEDLQR